MKKIEKGREIGWILLIKNEFIMTDLKRVPLEKPQSALEKTEIAAQNYEAIEKIGVCGNDAVLVTGLGPVGLAALMVCKAMGANQLIGVEMNDYRIDLAKKLGLVDHVFKPGDDTLEEILKVTGGHGVERAIDASASDPGRALAIRATRQWGKIAFVGEGGTCTFNPSPDIIHGQKTIYGSWVTSLWRMEELVERLVRWNIHPEDLITHEFPLERINEALETVRSGEAGRVVVEMG